MQKTMMKTLYLSALVVGGGILYYFYGRRLAADDLRAEQSAARNRKAYHHAISRWERDGGAIPASGQNGFHGRNLV